MGSVKALGATSKSQGDKTWIVNIRPDTHDLLPAILEDRPVHVTEVKTISQVFADHHESLKKKGLTVHTAPDAGISLDLQEAVASAQVVLFEEADCPYSERAAEALTSASIHFKRLDITQFRPSLRAATGKTSAPSVWINGVYVGGCNDGTQPWHGVIPMLRSGQFQEMIA